MTKDRDQVFETVWRAMSVRLRTVCTMVKGSGVLADVGTDHAYVPAALTAGGQFEKALALDVREGPLCIAEKNIRELGLENLVELRLSDGMEKLSPGETDTAVIAGMGGPLTVRILDKDGAVTSSLHELVLEPQSEVYRVRIWLRENGWRIEDEDMVLEDGKYYPVIRAVPGCEAGDGECPAAVSPEDFYGPVLIRKKNKVLRSYLDWEYGVKNAILDHLSGQSGEASRRREAGLRREIARNRKVFSLMEES